MRRVLVTGGGTGIGRAIAHEFAQAGDEVVITGRREGPLQEAANGFETIRTAPVDVTDEAQVKGLFETPFDVVVANAGAGQATKTANMSLEEWNRILTVNLTGVFLTFREALQGMGSGGRLIAIASTAGLQGGSNISAYSASKHGVIGLVKSLAKEVAKSEITCNAVCPGFVDTELAAGAVAGVQAKFGVDADKATAMIVAGNPMRRMIDVKEVSSAVTFLASPGASSVNGHAMSISGGEI